MKDKITETSKLSDTGSKITKIKQQFIKLNLLLNSDNDEEKEENLKKIRNIVYESNIDFDTLIDHVNFAFFVTNLDKQTECTEIIFDIMVKLCDYPLILRNFFELFNFFDLVATDQHMLATLTIIMKFLKNYGETLDTVIIYDMFELMINALFRLLEEPDNANKAALNIIIDILGNYIFSSKTLPDICSKLNDSMALRFPDLFMSLFSLRRKLNTYKNYSVVCIGLLIEISRINNSLIQDIVLNETIIIDINGLLLKYDLLDFSLRFFDQIFSRSYFCQYMNFYGTTYNDLSEFYVYETPLISILVKHTLETSRNWGILFHIYTNMVNHDNTTLEYLMNGNTMSAASSEAAKSSDLPEYDDCVHNKQFASGILEVYFGSKTIYSGYMLNLNNDYSKLSDDKLPCNNIQRYKNYTIKEKYHISDFFLLLCYHKPKYFLQDSVRNQTLEILASIVENFEIIINHDCTTHILLTFNELFRNGLDIKHLYFYDELCEFLNMFIENEIHYQHSNIAKSILETYLYKGISN